MSNQESLFLLLKEEHDGKLVVTDTKHAPLLSDKNGGRDDDNSAGPKAQVKCTAYGKSRVLARGNSNPNAFDLDVVDADEMRDNVLHDAIAAYNHQYDSAARIMYHGNNVPSLVNHHFFKIWKT